MENGEEPPASEPTRNSQEANDGDGDWSDSDNGAGDGSGIHFGLRVGYGFALGKLAGGSSSSSSGTGGTTTSSSYSSGDMSDGFAGQIPIWLDLGWQFSPKLMVGAYFSYGFVIPRKDLADVCNDKRVDCTLSDMRLGAQVQFSFSPAASTDPWIGAGFGYEWLNMDVENVSITLDGWEVPMLQAGLDFGGDTGGSVFGPFVAFTFGRYTHGSFKFGSLSDSGDVSDPATHNWLFVGLRGAVK